MHYISYILFLFSALMWSALSWGQPNYSVDKYITGRLGYGYTKPIHSAKVGVGLFNSPAYQSLTYFADVSLYRDTHGWQAEPEVGIEAVVFLLGAGASISPHTVQLKAGVSLIGWLSLSYQYGIPFREGGMLAGHSVCIGAQIPIYKRKKL